MTTFACQSCMHGVNSSNLLTAFKPLHMAVWVPLYVNYVLLTDWLPIAVYVATHLMKIHAGFRCPLLVCISANVVKSLTSHHLDFYWALAHPMEPTYI